MVSLNKGSFFASERDKVRLGSFFNKCNWWNTSIDCIKWNQIDVRIGISICESSATTSIAWISSTKWTMYIVYYISLLLSHTIHIAHIVHQLLPRMKRMVEFFFSKTHTCLHWAATHFSYVLRIKYTCKSQSRLQPLVNISPHAACYWGSEKTHSLVWNYFPFAFE